MSTAVTARPPPETTGPPPGHVRREGPARRAGRPWPAVAEHVALALLLAASASAFGRVLTAGDWGAPILGTAAGVLAVSTLTRRFVSSTLLASALDVLAVALLTVWAVIPASTSFGLPLGRTWRIVAHVASRLGPQIEAAVPPARVTTPFLLAATAGVALLTVLASWIAFRLDRRGWAVGPPLIVFLACCVLGTSRGRALSVAVEVAALGLWLLVCAVVESADPARWLGGEPPGGTGAAARSGARLVVLGVVVALLAMTFFHSDDGHGVFGWQSSGPGHTRIIVTPIVSLRDRIQTESHRDVFTVRSPVPSYWQLTTLDVFTGGTWQTGRASYSDFSRRLPGPGSPAPAHTRTVRETIHIEALDSPWLPLAFTPVAVSGASSVQYNAATGSLLTKRRTSNGETYTVTSRQYLATLDPTELARAPEPTRPEVPAGSLQLPPLPPSVVSLARHVVAGHRSEYAKALALQDFFHQPAFSYTLDPPSDGSGITALTTFLFRTREGYCQQFAGAYAVMARALGLPTRLAIGFTTGTPRGHDTYQVTDADVHTWPEVWFPRYGWVPFEPTQGSPSGGFTIPGTTQYTGNTAARRARTSRPVVAGPAPTTPTTGGPAPGGPRHFGGSTGAGAHLRRAGGTGTSSSAPRATRSPTGRSAGWHWGWLSHPLGGVAAGLVGLLCANGLGRRWRRRRRRRRAARPGADPVEDLLARWEEVAEALARVDLRRHPAETLRQFAGRAGVALAARRCGPGGAGDDLAGAAAALDAACWEAHPGRGPVSPDELTTLAGRLRAEVDRTLTARRRAWLLLDPRPSWRPRTLAAAAVPRGDEQATPTAGSRS